MMINKQVLRYNVKDTYEGRYEAGFSSPWCHEGSGREVSVEKLGGSPKIL
jgi:hypothetical protein